VAGQIYKQMQNRLARTEQVRDSIHVTKSFELGIQFNPQIYNLYFPIILKPNRITMSANRFLRFSELTVQNGNKIGLIGNNGSGKSTFINYFFKQLKIEKDKVIYIPQEIPAAQAKAIIDDVRNFNDIEKGQVMTLIRRLGSNPVHVLETEIPSPGEVRKLLLAQGLMRNPAIIIMDEPTNHMDLPSIECLESALTECGCTQILVSHDHIFLSQIVDHYWKFEPDDSGGFKINTRY
jgi:macrolide transport system ATP-binding/permease protein